MNKLQEIKEQLKPVVPDERQARRLSKGEAEVFAMIGQGMSTREIAKTLGRSIKTIETHRAHMKIKLDIDSGSMLVYYAVLVGAGK